MAYDVGLGIVVEYGTLGTGDTDPATYTALAGVADIKMPTVKLAKPKVKISTHGTTGAHKYIPGKLKDVDDYTIKINYDKAVATTLFSLVGLKKGWKITKSDGSTYKHVGWISGLGAADPTEDVMDNDITISVSGDITFTAAA